MAGLERAAMALYEMGRPASATAEHWNLEWSEIGEGSRNEHREQARAVLMAVRDDPGAHWHEDGRANFAAFIDAILNEKDMTND